jgi:Protein of unknown function (DUF3987)
MSTSHTHSLEKSLTYQLDKDTKIIDLKAFGSEIDIRLNSASISSDNEFPLDVFPRKFKKLINDYNKSLNFPIDYTGTAILVAVSTVVGTTAKIKVKNGWHEYPSVWSCLIGNAGANKTHPINNTFSPLKFNDKINHNDFEKRYRDYEDYKKLTKEEKDLIPKVTEPKLTKSILTNFTPEVLHKILSQNPRGCTILSDEMLTFFEGMNNYSKGDQIGAYLSFWSNQPTTIDRISNPMPLLISHPYLSIIGGLQPRMLSSAFPIQKLNNGFYQRFLFAFPDGGLKQPINENELNNSVFEEYKAFIADYYFNNEVSETDRGLNSRIFMWTPEAKDFFYQWQKENCDLVNQYPNTIKGEIASKFDIHFVRLALLLQIMENPKSTEIELTAVIGAKKLCNYYLHCSFKTLDVIQNPLEYSQTLVENKKRLYDKLNEEFTTAEAIALGLEFDVLERRVKEFLKDTILFRKMKHGFYKKNIKSN